MKISKLHYITNGRSEAAILDEVETAINAGVDWVQLRIKDTSLDFLTIASKVKLLCAGKAIFLINDKVEITSQNHGFEIIKESLPKNVELTHKSLFDNCIEGIKLKNRPVFSVQYHPESNPGPQDSHYLFKQFIYEVIKNAKKKRY